MVISSLLDIRDRVQDDERTGGDGLVVQARDLTTLAGFDETKDVAWVTICEFGDHFVAFFASALVVGFERVRQLPAVTGSVLRTVGAKTTKIPVMLLSWTDTEHDTLSSAIVSCQC